MQECIDLKAISLEKKSLWRRAASRWLDVMMISELSDEQRLWVYHRRCYCLSKISDRVFNVKFQYYDILLAARALEKKMGINTSYQFNPMNRSKVHTMSRIDIEDLFHDISREEREIKSLDVVTVLINSQSDLF